jgi:hypothetical protein
MWEWLRNSFARKSDQAEMAYKDRLIEALNATLTIVAESSESNRKAHIKIMAGVLLACGNEVRVPRAIIDAVRESNVEINVSQDPDTNDVTYSLTLHSEGDE